jgi:prepilin-type N-terminal cleavage/methylation domain-containing protein
MRKHGVTLIELLIVVIILAILASIALPQYFKTADRVRTAEAMDFLGALRSAEVRYAAINPNGTYVDATQLGSLDVKLAAIADLQSWDTLVISIGAGPTGVASLQRSGGGPYAGQQVGLTFGKGILCGTYLAYFDPPGGPACAPD